MIFKVFHPSARLMIYEVLWRYLCPDLAFLNPDPLQSFTLIRSSQACRWSLSTKGRMAVDSTRLFTFPFHPPWGTPARGWLIIWWFAVEFKAVHWRIPRVEQNPVDKYKISPLAPRCCSFALPAATNDDETSTGVIYGSDEYIFSSFIFFTS